MSLDLRPVQVRLSNEEYEALKMLAEANDHDLGEEAARLLGEMLLGKAHGIKLLHARLSRAVKTDKLR